MLRVWSRMYAEWHVYDTMFFLSSSEFLEVGKKQPALDVLYDVIKSKKHRTWQKIHEPIMLKYLELCVDLRKSHLAKEGLYQYKNICQQVCLHLVFPCVVFTWSELIQSRNECLLLFRWISNPLKMWSVPTWNLQKRKRRRPKRSLSRWFWTLRIWTTFRHQRGTGS